MVKDNNMLKIEGLSLKAGEFRLGEIFLNIKAGEYFILLGPTGCGKTMLVETICGLNKPDSGSIHLGGCDITDTDPARRRIGYVPQDYALLPFKTVEQNVAFGLEAQGLRRAEISSRLDYVTDMLDIEHLRKRLPSALSGGERQRVALGRALAVEPDILVLDEPLSALDEVTCRDLMGRLKALHGSLKTTFVHICHRLEEALTLGDKLALIRDGKVVQAGTPKQFFSQPNNLFVAEFLRLPNLLKGKVRASANGNVFFLQGEPVKKTDLPEGDAYAIVPFEKMHITLRKQQENRGVVLLTAPVKANSAGPHDPGLVLGGGVDMKVPGIFPPEIWQEGQNVYISFPTSSLHVLPADGREAVEKTVAGCKMYT